MHWLFWISTALVAYTLLGYPLIALLLAGLGRRGARSADFTPSVSFIIAAYNEEVVLAEKIRQTLALDYPAAKLEILVASDGSTDRTDEIASSFSNRGVKLFRSNDRRGKTHTLNGAVAAATGEIIVFSDATGVFSSNAIRLLVSHFADPAVGCVGGRVTYRYGADATSKGFSFYQRFAVAVRSAESAWGSETSVSGSIHAIRRELYRSSDPAFSLDVIDPVHTVAAGRRVLYERDAISLEESRTRPRDEFRARVRIAVRGISMVPYILRMLLWPLRPVYLFQMISHKFFRWWLWLFLTVLFVSSALLAPRGGFYMWAFVIQSTAYACGVIALLSAFAGIRLPGLSTLSLFVLGNTAMAVGAIKALFGHRMPKWEPVR